jgi:CRISPR-associated protein Cas2
MLVVVAYDVADDRRRVRLHTLLLGYGNPVQESVFECEVTPKQKASMQRRVERLIRPGTDRVRYYVLCETCAGKVEDAQGHSRQPPPAVYVV